MGLCSSKNAIAPQKPLKTLEQLEQEGEVESGKPTAFVIPADDEMLVSTKKPEDLEAEKERLAKERSQLSKLQKKIAEKEKKAEENRQKELDKIVARQEEREERARQVQEKKKTAGQSSSNNDIEKMESKGSISGGKAGKGGSMGALASSSGGSGNKLTVGLKPVKVPAHLRNRMNPNPTREARGSFDFLDASTIIPNEKTLPNADSAVIVAEI